MLALIPVLFNTEDPDACPRCVEELRSPKPRRSPRTFQDRCGAFIRVQDDESGVDDKDDADPVILYTCIKLYGHDDVHRSGSGAIWLSGQDDFIPPPDGFV